MINITKVLNNNTICGTNEEGIEIIAFGKGIGFSKKTGDVFDGKEAQNVYHMLDEAQYKRYENLVVREDPHILEVSEEAIAGLSQRFGKNFDSRIHIALLDHIIFSVKRYKENILVENIFSEEIEYLYPDEYKYSKAVLDTINQKLRISLPDAEAGFICMHIHAALHNEDMSFGVMIVQILKDITNIIEEELGIKLQTYDFCMHRLITHIKFAIRRASDKVEIKNVLGDMMNKNYKRTYNVALKVAEILKEKYGISINEAEKNYLTLHIQYILETWKEENKNRNGD